MDILSLFETVGISGLLDITFMSIIIYSTLVWFRRTRAAFVVIGMFMLGAAYLLARQLDLSLTISVFQGFFAIILIAVVVIFQEEIKHILEQLASRSMISSLRARRLLIGSRREIDILVNTLRNFSRERVGAILVLAGRDPLGRHLEGGVELSGELSEALLGAIFHPGSPGHDGATIIAGNKISSFSCYLPLSRNLRKLQKTGTRHAAALGLAERTDALCLVVSEERGTISAARNGDITVLSDPNDLPTLLESFYRELTPPTGRRSWVSVFTHNYREKLLAVTVTVILWFFFVHEARIDYRSFTVPVQVNGVSGQCVVQKIEPSELEVTLSGSRRSFYFVTADRIRVELKLYGAKTGTYRRVITRSNISAPEALYVENVQPAQIVVQVAEKPR